MTWESVIKRESYPTWKRKKLIKIAEENNYDFHSYGKSAFEIDDARFDRWVDEMLDMFGHWYHEAMRVRHPTEEQTKLFGWKNEEQEEMIKDMRKAFNELQKLVPSKMKRA